MNYFISLATQHLHKVLHKMETSKIRGFRLSEEMDKSLTQKAKEKGFLTPSEYIRAVIRKELEKEAEKQ